MISFNVVTETKIKDVEVIIKTLVLSGGDWLLVA